MIKRKALALFPKLYPTPDEAFRASKGWLTRMLRRNKLTYRRVTSVRQKVPVDAPERAEAFLAAMKNSYEDYPMIGNMDETGCYFDAPRSTTFDFSGVQSVKAKTTGYEKLRYTVVLTAGVQSQAGQWKAVKLPPMIIFKNLKKAPKRKFPPGMIVTGTKDGTMTRELMMASYLKLFKRRPECFFEQEKPFDNGYRCIPYS